MKARSQFTGRLSDVDIRLLRIFCTVAECGGFAAAESELQLGLPSISRYIKDLETRLGVRLCRRGRTGFSLTEEGGKVREASLQLLRSIGEFEADMRTVHAELHGVLNLGMADTLLTDARFALPEVIAAFSDLYPRVVVNLSVDTSNRLEQRLIDGKLDAAIILARRRLRNLHHMHLHKERCSLFCAPTHPLILKGDIDATDLLEHRYVGYAYADNDGRTLADSDTVLVPFARVDHSEAIATLIATGHFFGYLPQHYVEATWRCSEFRMILENFSFDADVDLVRREAEPAPLLREFFGIFERVVEARRNGHEETCPASPLDMPDRR